MYENRLTNFTASSVNFALVFEMAFFRKGLYPNQVSLYRTVPFCGSSLSQASWIFGSDRIQTSYQGLETSSLACLAPGYFRCFCNRVSRPQLVYSVESSIDLYRLLSTVFGVLIFSHPSDLQKQCAKRSILGRCFRDPGLDAESASSSCATLVGSLYWIALTILSVVKT